jgi:hypothetical protein
MDKPKLISMISDALMPLELAVKRKRGAGDATSGGKGKDEGQNKGDDEVTGGGGGGGEGDDTWESRRGREGPAPCEGEFGRVNAATTGRSYGLDTSADALQWLMPALAAAATHHPREHEA